MRKAEAAEALGKSLKNHFPSDVAAAITNDSNMFDRIVANVVRGEVEATTLDGRIDVVASDTNDGTKDWLVDTADSPAGWLYGQMDRWW